MKKSIFKGLLLFAFFSFGTYGFAQVAIGTTGDPDASSMLDIQSTTKGVLIPRMTTAQRTPGISSPANGLLVFDTTTKSFWFYNVNVWKELTSGSSLIDDDGDTRVEVEQSADDDKIRFTTLANERMTIDNAGNTKIGDGINNTYIESDGSLSYEGTATRWDDLKVPVNAVKVKNITDPPVWDDFIGSTGLLWFEGAKSQDVIFTIQMPHAWKEGTAIFPHVHWTSGRTGDSAPGATRVTWGLEYYWANPGDVFPTSTTAITGNTAATNPLPGSIALREHVITPLGSGGITGTGTHTLSSMLVCRLYRVNDGDYSGDAGLLEIDFHYQIDSDGSRQEYIK